MVARAERGARPPSQPGLIAMCEDIMNITFRLRSLIVAGLFLQVAIAVQAAPAPLTGNHDTDWFKAAK